MDRTTRWYVGLGAAAVAAATVLAVVLVGGETGEPAVAGETSTTTARPKPTVDLAAGPAWTSAIHDARGRRARRAGGGLRR